MTLFISNVGLGEVGAAGVATGAMGTSGYAILPMMTGSTRRTFIIQWGSLSPLKSGNTVEISLPVAFPNLFMQAFATHDNATQFTRPTVYALSTTSRTVLSATATCLNAPAVGAGVTRSSDDAACFGRYIAIGY
jgi:hypothetical protein